MCVPCGSIDRSWLSFGVEAKLKSVLFYYKTKKAPKSSHAVGALMCDWRDCPYRSSF